MSKNTTTLKKAYCPKCKPDNDFVPVFDVNPEADVCYCPTCMSAFKPKVVIDYYNLFLSTRLSKADKLLFRDTKFMDAYEAYGNILKLDNSVYRARFGRILALIYMSTLRKSNFLTARLLLDNEAEQHFRKMKDQSAYIKFLYKVNFAIDEYNRRFARKLIYRDRFFNADCVELYFLRKYEIIELKKAVLDEIEKSYYKYDDRRSEDLIKKIKESLQGLAGNLEKPVAIMDGSRYKFSKVVHDRTVYMTALPDSLNPYTHKVRHKLNENEKKGRLIRDKVYPDNSHITALIRTMLVLMILFYVLSGSSLTTGLVINVQNLKNLLLFGAIGLAAFALISTILFIIWKIKLSKRRHLID